MGGLKAALGYAPSMFMFLSPRDCRPFVPALPAGERRERARPYHTRAATTSALQPFQQKMPFVYKFARTTTCSLCVAG